MGMGWAGDSSGCNPLYWHTLKAEASADSEQVQVTVESFC